MAPRKKRVSKNANGRKGKQPQKPPEEPKNESEVSTEIQDNTEAKVAPVADTARSALKPHKNFGKYRFLNNENALEDLDVKSEIVTSEGEGSCEAAVETPSAEIEMFDASEITIEEAGEVVVGGEDSNSVAALLPVVSETQEEITTQMGQLEVTAEIEDSTNDASPTVEMEEVFEANESEESSEATVEEVKPAIIPEKTKIQLTKAEKIKQDLELKFQQGSNSDGSTPSESSIRRSTRIKTINVMKQRSTKSHGLVKPKSENNSPKTIDSDLSENSNSTNTDTEKPKSEQPTKESDQKPVKVKSRWRRSSELEMSSNSPCLESPQTTTDSTMSAGSLEKQKNDNEEVERRLKQFVHLKENHYLTDRVCDDVMTCDCFLTPEEVERGEYGCGEDCLNRLVLFECGVNCSLGDRCTNKRFQKAQFSPCEVFNTDKKGLGLRAKETIPFGEFILEYVGEVVDHDEFDKRANGYSKGKNPHYYFMSLRSDAVIDATMKGNISRFINHSCDPNAETQKWTVNGELRIGFFSKRTISAGEEITFDYQFQRYGKEAQKCFCEAPSCRGWLGEQPDEDDDEEYDEEEEDEEQEHEDATSKKSSLTPSKEKTIKKERKKRVAKRKSRKELFESTTLDDEIVTLSKTGLKNQAHTLTLTRLLARAKDPAQRSKLLKLLRHADLPCRRLFLDYHGLRLIHVWMTEVQQLVKEDKKFESLRLEILQTLAVLPIPNKTTLQDSKVLPCVEKWSVPEVEKSPENATDNSPKEPPPNVEPEKLENVKKEETSDRSDIILDETGEEINISEVRRSVGMCQNMKNDTSPSVSGKKLAELLVGMFEEVEEDEEVKKEKEFDYQEEIVALAVKLLEEWSSLKEVFRIPKKERIEQMKEHEREANKKYQAILGLELENDRKTAARYRNLQRPRLPEKPDTQRKTIPPKSDPQNSSLAQITKHERRMLFAMKVEHEEERKRLKQRELWLLQQEQQLKERQRALLAAEPQRFATPFDGQIMWNQWQQQPVLPHFSSYLANMDPQTLANVPGAVMPNQMIPTIPPPLPQTPRMPSMLPNMGMTAPLPKAGPVQIRPPLPFLNQPPPLPFEKAKGKGDDEEGLLQVMFAGPIPPPVKLPPQWKRAKDKYGRPYYYHVKVRKSQWEPPELNGGGTDDANPDGSSSSSSSESSSDSSDSSSEESDSDDEIDDTKLMLNIKGKLAAKAEAQKICEIEPEKEVKNVVVPKRKSSIDERLKEMNLVKEEEGETPAKKKRAGLVQEIIISPRTEEDRLQFREDLKKIKENKEMLKRQKELLLQQKATQNRVPAKKKSVKSKFKDMVDMNSEAAKRIKETFRSNMAGVIVSILNAYRKQDCKEARITNTDDFKHLARKLTHFVMLKELKHCENIEELTCTENVKVKAKEFVRKYMSKFGKVYQRPKDDGEF